MNLDDQLSHYFGTSDLGAVTPAVLATGVERMAVDLGLEKDRERKFALWALMQTLGVAPELAAVFKDDKDRDAARNFMDLADRVEEA